MYCVRFEWCGRTVNLSAESQAAAHLAARGLARGWLVPVQVWHGADLLDTYTSAGM